MMAGQVQYHVEPAFSISFAPYSSKSRAGPTSVGDLANRESGSSVGLERSRRFAKECRGYSFLPRAKLFYSGRRVSKGSVRAAQPAVSRAPFVQAPARDHVLHPAVGTSIEERDEA